MLIRYNKLIICIGISLLTSLFKLKILSFVVSFFFLSFPTTSFSKDVSIAVLAFSGTEYAGRTWQPTIDYLNRHIPEHEFSMVAIEPSDITLLEKLVEQQKVDFVITQPISFVELQVKYGATSILTLVDESKYAKFGSVIFTRADSDIANLSEVDGRSIAGATPKGLGGWLIGYNELINQGVNVLESSDVSYLGVQENIVNAVLSGAVDVGIVRTGVIERLAKKNQITLRDIKIINAQIVENFPYLLSTSLYPEWAFVKAGHASKRIAKDIAATLLHMPPGSKEAMARGYWEWVTPIDYQPIHNLMQKLRIGVYENYGKVSLLQYIKDNLLMSILVAFLLLVAIISGLWVLRLNGKLKQVNFFVEQKNDMMLNSVSEGIYGVDTFGRCTFVNQSLINITGWEEADMIGKMQHDILHHTHADGSVHPSDECPVYKTFQDGITRFEREDVFWKKNGDSFFVEYSVTPIRDTLNNITGSVVVFRDITNSLEQKQLERRHRNELEHINRLNTMGELVTGIAHELNQPLTAIATSAFASSKMIEAGKCSTEKMLDVFEVISLQAEHAAGVIRHMRRLSDNAQVDHSMIDINSRIKGVATLMSTNIKDAHVKLVLNLTSNIPEFLAQPIQIDQALINLCKNAIDSMAGNTSNRVLTISTKVDGKILEISIEDSGSGIDSEMQKRLFESFASQKKDGMGLGLSITRSIIERHYGNLYLSSTSKKGSIFIINLPLEMNKI